MAYILPNLSPPLLQSKDKSSSILLPITSPVSTATVFPQTTLPRSLAQVKSPPSAQEKQQNQNQNQNKDQDQEEHDQRNDFYVNLGSAVRTLREDLPLLFSKDLNYDIYRDDITFVDPLNTFTGIDRYRLIFWALRFHGRILFREISLDVLRVWQPSENMILIRWNLRGIPRVPWEARGEFQGTSRYKLDRTGKIYEHKVDNLAFNFPQTLRPAASVLDLVAACPASPNPTFLWGSAYDDGYSNSWIEFYRAVKGTLDQQDLSMPQDCFAACL